MRPHLQPRLFPERQILGCNSFPTLEGWLAHVFHASQASHASHASCWLELDRRAEPMLKVSTLFSAGADGAVGDGCACCLSRCHHPSSAGGSRCRPGTYCTVHTYMNLDLGEEKVAGMTKRQHQQYQSRTSHSESVDFLHTYECLAPLARSISST
jgi:hypothetical protein